MRHFAEPVDLGNGLSWTAEYTSWDWAHHGRFYFIITLLRDSEVIKKLNVYTCDYAWQDPSCRYSDRDIAALVRSELHALAQAGESICEFV